ncbi:hypothetical protein [Ruminococcus sp.]|uniref:hypothetical protein n=1 Tax=Ruminococcus sp. TaxID=41978 RepID=UPI0020642A45|nr:hypothetical protein [Ruminococcus sp.]MEE1396813.1 hypothetical protein [Ruminococcus sp.]DAY63655.1 MAG TPA: hypothetical protein [Caudoviricetes sp.]
MKAELVELLESIGYPAFLQGSLNKDEPYPGSFFTFWNFNNPEKAFYNNDASRCAWGFWVYFYSDDPQKVEEVPEQARKLLKSHGWVMDGKAHDISVDRPTHTGAYFTAYKLEEYEEES